MGSLQYCTGAGGVDMSGFLKLTRPEAIIHADAVLSVSFERRDPDTMRRFLQDFGLLPVATRGAVEYFRGVGTSPYLVAIRASSRDAFTGFTLAACNEAALQTLSTTTSIPITDADEPGGGHKVRLVDPDGLTVDVVHGFEPASPLPTPTGLIPVNTPLQKPRLNAPVRPRLAPSPIFKLGHVVLERPNFDRAAHWYMRHFGLIPSDVQCLSDGCPALGFFRLDRGQAPADHHSLALLGGPGTRLLHVSFETYDLDAVGQGNQYLRAHGWTHHWGIGRHVLGSQVFDYWKDPAGDEWEHYADGDVMTCDYPTGYTTLTRGGLWSWGDDLPDSMRPVLPLEEVVAIHKAGGFGEMELSRVEGLIRALGVPPRPWLR
jgi:catechol 2,3-dioxygenase-like lactoylglutathione lyase family enzyme